MRNYSLLPGIEETPNPELPISEEKDGKRNDANDIWILCSICQKHIDRLLFFSHKRLHKAFTQMRYKLWEKPTTIENVTLQRRQVMAEKKTSLLYMQREVQKINHCYEIIKRTLSSTTEYTSEVKIKVCKNTQVYKRDVNNVIIRSIVVCSDKNTECQDAMEDTFTALDNFGQRKNTTFVGLFDGFHGISAAYNVSMELPVILLSQLVTVDPSFRITAEESKCISSFDTLFKDSYKEAENTFSSVIEKKSDKETDFKLIHASYAKAFWRMDRILKLGREENSVSRWSGCTAVTCLLDGLTNANESQVKDDLLIKNDEATSTPKHRLGMLHIANVGTIKAVLCKNGKSYCLTKDHSTSSSRERIHVLDTGGSLSSNENHGLVEGLCKLTRGLGFHGDIKLKNSVIPAPYTISVPIYDSCQFIIVASSGLWDVLDEKEVVAMTREGLASFLHGARKKPEDFNNHTLQSRLRVTVSNTNIQQEDYDQTNTAVSRPLSNYVVEADNSNIVPSNKMGSEMSVGGTQNWSEIYSNAAAHVCKQLVETAILTGSQQNVTVCLILLPGLDKEVVSDD
ncbi:protein phosphatase 2C-like domain-containing protein 1 [Pelodytes ibericus]